jgi:hypothetical protein
MGCFFSVCPNRDVAFEERQFSALVVSDQTEASRPDIDDQSPLLFAPADVDNVVLSSDSVADNERPGT